MSTCILINLRISLPRIQTFTFEDEDSKVELVGFLKIGSTLSKVICLRPLSHNGTPNSLVILSILLTL